MIEKEYIYILKALAIFCVICAHVSIVKEDAGIISMKCGELFNYFGTIGVPVFMILSGYLFEKNKKSFVEFWERKLVSIVIPWIFCGTLLWLYIVIRKGEASFLKWLLFILGYNHSTYYLSVLLILYVIFWGKTKDWKLYIMLVLSIFSIVSTGWHIGINFINSIFGTFYLNPLNWIAFFVVGIIISKKDVLLKYAKWCSQRMVMLIVVSLAYFLIMTNKGEFIYYFSKYSLFAHVVNVSFIMGVGFFLLIHDKKRILIFIGEVSFSIYLLHQFVTGVVIQITNKIGSFFLVFMRPYIVLITILCIIFILKKIEKNKFRILKLLIGLR